MSTDTDGAQDVRTGTSLTLVALLLIILIAAAVQLMRATGM